VLSSDLRRTRETAAPLAAALGLEVELYDPGALEELLPVLTGAPGRTLVVGHSNTTPQLVELLGGAPGEPIDEPTEYDRLYTLVLAADAEVVTIRTRYGEPAALPGPLEGVPPGRAGAPRDPGGPAMTREPPS
jgi:broad specificity phosphatase PhoE